MNQDEHKIVVRRMAGLIAAASVLIAVYVLRLIFLQLVNSDSFKAQATNTTDYNFTVTAARGDIVDSAGRRIAASTTSYNVVLSKLLMAFTNDDPANTERCVGQSIILTGLLSTVIQYVKDEGACECVT